MCCFGGMCAGFGGHEYYWGLVLHAQAHTRTGATNPTQTATKPASRLSSSLACHHERPCYLLLTT